jgi:tetratricopeptide (TPR) repeat protein
MRLSIALLAAVAATFGIEPAFAKCSVDNFALLSVTMEGANPITRGEINGTPVRFIVDSGAFFSTLGPAVAHQLNLHTTALPPEFQLRGIGGSADASITKVNELKLAGMPLKGIVFIVGGSDTGTAGLIGQNVLGLRDVEYDLQHGAVRLMQAKECADANLAYWAGDRPVSVLPIERTDDNNRHTIGTVLVNGVKLRAIFDTGAGRAMITQQAARRAGIKLDGPNVQHVGYSRGIGGRQVPILRTTFDSIDVGGEKLRNVTLEIGDFGIEADMLIGVDFFLAHRVYVSNEFQKMYFTYDGGPVFGVSPIRAVSATGETIAVSDTGKEPTDAAGYSARGAAFASKHDLASALADLNRAIELAPNEGRYFFERAQVRLALQQPAEAMADMSTARKLAPTDPEILLAHGQMALARRDRESALEDVKAADAALAPEALPRLNLAQLYSALGDHETALTNFDTWLHFHSEDSLRPAAFNGRCYARALLNRDLDKALSDCNTAIRLRPNTAVYFESRGLVHLRRGDNDAAIADLTAALNLSPNRPLWRYERSLAEARLGQDDAAKRDRDAASAIDPRIADAAARMGL